MATAVDLAPQAVGNRYNFGRVLAAKGRFADAAAQFEQAANLTGMRDPAILDMLAAMYAETGRYAEAAATAQKALGLAGEQRNTELAASLKSSLERYEALARAGSGGSAAKPQR
jgi:tetratricopeptide (TPR) repeat protein